MKRLTIILLIILNAGYLLAQDPCVFNDEESKTGYSGIQNTTEMSVDLTRIFSSNTRYRLKSSEIYATLDLGDNYFNFEQESFSCEINFSLSYHLGLGGQMGETVNRTILVTQDQPYQTVVIDATSNILNGADHVNLTYTVTITPESSLENVYYEYINSNLTFKLLSKTEYAIDVRDPVSMELHPPLMLLSDTYVEGRYMDFEWDSPNGIDYPSYEIQVTKLENTSELALDDPELVEGNVDWKNAFTLFMDSPQKNVTLAVVDGTGVYLWRVRPVGNYYDGGIANSQNYGEWSYSPDQNSLLQVSWYDLPQYAFLKLTNSGEFFKNWIYERVFTEGDDNDQGFKYSESINYYDYLNFLRQTQNRINTNEENSYVVVSENIPDYSGRSAWTSLPKPTDNSSLDGYNSKLLKNESGGEYTQEDFDSDITLNNPARTDTTKPEYLGYSYYSGGNPDKRIPSANGYSFARVIYATDGTMRVIEQSLPGKMHSIGNKTRKYFISSAADDELIRIFGEEAPLGESVLKKYTMDENGLISVEYISKEGNIIATALYSNETSNLMEISSGDNSFEVTNTTRQNIINNNGFVSSRRIVVNGSPLTLTYRIAGFAPVSGCVDVDMFGGYKLVFIIYNSQDHTLYQSNEIQIEELNTNYDYADDILSWTTIQGEQTLSSTSKIVNLPPGEYILSKSLQPILDNQAMFAYQDSVTEIVNAITNLLNMVEMSQGLTHDQLIQKMDSLNNFFVEPVNEQGIIDLLDLTRGVPEGFTFHYDTQTSNMQMGLSCCQSANATLPGISNCPFCEEAESIRENTTLNNSEKFDSMFELVYENLIYPLHDTLTGLSEFSYHKVMPGFTYEKMAFMLTNMLMSEYYTGFSKEYNGTWYKALTDINGDLVFADQENGELQEFPATWTFNVNDLTEITNSLDYNYDPENIYNCWIATLSAISHAQGGGQDDIDIMDSYNEATGGENSEGFFDDQNSAFGWLMNAILSHKMRKYNDSDEGQVASEEQNNLVNVPNMFIECIGYQFADIIDDEMIAANSVPSEYFEFESYSVPSGLGTINVNYNWPEEAFIDNSPYLPQNSDLYENNIPVLMDEESAGSAFFAHLFDGGQPVESVHELCFPYMFKPEWMFKYFVFNAYDNTTLPDYAGEFRPHSDIEHLNCYDTSYTIGSLDYPPCFCQCHMEHENWDYVKRYSFYEQLKGAPLFEENEPEITSDSLLQTCPDNTELDQMVDERLNHVKTVCDQRKAEFKEAIADALYEACYTIDECSDAANFVVSYQQLEMLTVNAVNTCKAIVDTIADKPEYDVLDPSFYPACSLEPCAFVENDGTLEVYGEPTVVLFEDCDELKLQRIETWEFIPFFQSQCQTPVSHNYNGNECEFENDYSNVIHVSNN